MVERELTVIIRLLDFLLVQLTKFDTFNYQVTLNNKIMSMVCLNDW